MWRWSGGQNVINVLMDPELYNDKLLSLDPVTMVEGCPDSWARQGRDVTVKIIPVKREIYTSIKARHLRWWREGWCNMLDTSQETNSPPIWIILSPIFRDTIARYPGQ